MVFCIPSIEICTHATTITKTVALLTTNPRIIKKLNQKIKSIIIGFSAVAKSNKYLKTINGTIVGFIESMLLNQVSKHL